MNGLTKPRLVLLTMVFGLCFSAAHAAEPATEQARADVGRDVTVMARVLESRLGDELRQDVLTGSMFQRGVQGFYVPDVGALFFINVKFALAEPPKDKPEEKAKPADLWDRAEKEVEGRGMERDIEETLLRAGSMTVMHDTDEVDADKVERLKQTILEALAQYGQRMQSVGDNERIVVVISGRTGGRRLMLHGQLPAVRRAIEPHMSLPTLEMVVPHPDLAPEKLGHIRMMFDKKQQEALEAIHEAQQTLDKEVARARQAAGPQSEQEREAMERALEEARKQIAAAEQTVREQLQAEKEKVEADLAKARANVETARLQAQLEAQKAHAEVTRALADVEAQVQASIPTVPNSPAVPHVQTSTSRTAGGRQVLVSSQADAGSVLVIVIQKKDLVDDPKELSKRATVEGYVY